MWWAGVICGFLIGSGTALAVTVMALYELSSYYERRLRLIRHRNWSSLPIFNPGRYDDGETLGVIPASAELAELNRMRRRLGRPAGEIGGGREDGAAVDPRNAATSVNV